MRSCRGCQLLSRSMLQAARRSLLPPGWVLGSIGRQISTSTSAMARALLYDSPGEPLDVLRLEQQDPKHDGAPGADEIAIEMILAPINPSDINTVQGKYPLMPQLPKGVPGHEGVGRVAAVGSGVSGFKQGDLVVPFEPAQGTWRQRGVFPATAFMAIPNDTPIEAAAQLIINPPSALGMLETVVELQPGDVVVQNGGTSAVAQLVAQLGKQKGIRVVSTIRDRPNWEETEKHLKELGAEVVTTDDKLPDALKSAGLPAPKLALNCVSGPSALALAKSLAPGGTLVTYGAMSMQPMSLPVSLLIFKDIRFVGFWLSGRMARELGPEKRKDMILRLANMYREGKLQAPKAQAFPLDQWREAFTAVNTAHKGAKIMLSLNP